MFRKRLYLCVYFWLSWVFVAVGASRAAATGGCHLVAALDLLIAVASLVAEHGSRACGRQQVPHAGPALRPRSLGTGPVAVVPTRGPSTAAPRSGHRPGGCGAWAY